MLRIHRPEAIFVDNHLPRQRDSLLGRPRYAGGYQSNVRTRHQIVPIPPEQSAFSNREKAVERDVEVYRKKAQSIYMYFRVRSADVVSYNANFPPTGKEQQAFGRMFDHRQSNRRIALALSEQHA